MSAFRIFVTLYTRKYPADAPALMKYGDVIQDLASRSHNWKFYDENFRFMRQSQPEAYPWGTVQWELWLRSQVTPQSSQSTPATHRVRRHPSIMPSPRVIVTVFREGRSVQVAHTSMCVSNATEITVGCNALFVSQRDQPRPHPKQSHNLPTPINADRLRNFLVGYTPSTVEFLYAGFTKEFPLRFEGEFLSFEAENLLSARDHPDAVFSKIKKETEALRLAGLFEPPPFTEFRVSPLGVVPKKVPGEFRMIHHLSVSSGFSVNDGILSANTSVQYATIADAISLIKQCGKGCFLANTDIKDAFRIIPIQPSNNPLLGMKWNGLDYYDRCMPMGCSSSCKTFETFSSALEWLAKTKLQISTILHLLDDFLIVAPTAELCNKQLQLFLDVCQYLGVPMAPEKTVGPLPILSFAGIELHTQLQLARLPKDKLDKCTDLISNLFRRKKVTLVELQSMIGLLNFACSVIISGRAFRLIDLTIGVKAAHHRIRLTSQEKEDLRVWLEFLNNFNGKSFFCMTSG